MDTDLIQRWPKPDGWVRIHDSETVIPMLEILIEAISSVSLCKAISQNLRSLHKIPGLANEPQRRD
jgi:hypothetical protein